MSNKLSLYTIEAVQHNVRSEDSFWDNYYPRLQKYCCFLAQSKWDGEDLAQEATVKAMTYYSRDKITSALLNKIAHNHWMDTLRKRKRENLGNREIGDNTFSPMGDTACSVDLLLDRFTPRQAIIFILKEGFQYQSKEIAEILNTTEMAVKSSINRAKKRIENQGELHSLDSFWEDKEREQLWHLFYDSLVSQDPTVLIKAIPSIRSIMDVPQAFSKKSIPFTASNPLSTLCMAA
ncbi:RNA polymerase sigma-70 factor (ECF subfamily) [Neobacillus niacini]|uniref:sigma factor-like helix-turn-helix DNA-binding protein n=1 Tax=Neobacillus niacini TaxID=86668 RepID=UPI00285CF471|nr:sigma factor-like helix-turn-helix DNA-binding protein [Neobacillus niacini]MDR7077629.1 RNA polymerase sigma-70 factor (ECF subfamily) [Neobacillus niacini]